MIASKEHNFPHYSVCNKTFVNLIHIMSEMLNKNHVFLGVCEGGVVDQADVKVIKGGVHLPTAQVCYGLTTVSFHVDDSCSLKTSLVTCAIQERI